MPLTSHCRKFAATLITASVLCIASAANAQAPDDRAALSGLSEVKVAFDITTGDAKALLARLNIIDETRQSIIQQGVKPSFVLAFRGPATRLVQTDPSKFKPEDHDTVSRIAAKIKEMNQSVGVTGIEQCSLAVRQNETKVANVLPEIKVVGSTWTSLMAYQARGYAYINP